MSELMDWDGAAKALGVSSSFIRRLWNERKLSGVKVGRLVRFSQRDIDEFIERNRVKAVHGVSTVPWRHEFDKWADGRLGRPGHPIILSPEDAPSG